MKITKFQYFPIGECFCVFQSLNAINLYTCMYTNMQTNIDKNNFDRIKQFYQYYETIQTIYVCSNPFNLTICV